MNNTEQYDTTGNPVTTTSNVNQPQPQKQPKAKTNKLVLLALLLLALLALATGYLAFQLNTELKNAEEKIDSMQIESNDLLAQHVSLQDELEMRKNTTGENDINKEAYQAVFLKNDQVYFGKITDISETRITLENIYYLRSNGQPVGTSAEMGADVSLVKLGSELHGPEDKMFIERKEVEYWENLKADGQVSSAIKEHKAANQ